jgi:hypothetical protein
MISGEARERRVSVLVLISKDTDVGLMDGVRSLS